MRLDFRIILMPGALCLVRSDDDLFKKHLREAEAGTACEYVGGTNGIRLRI